MVRKRDAQIQLFHSTGIFSLLSLTQSQNWLLPVLTGHLKCLQPHHSSAFPPCSFVPFYGHWTVTSHLDSAGASTAQEAFIAFKIKIKINVTNAFILNNWVMPKSKRCSVWKTIFVGTSTLHFSSQNFVHKLSLGIFHDETGEANFRNPVWSLHFQFILI